MSAVTLSLPIPSANSSARTVTVSQNTLQHSLLSLTLPEAAQRHICTRLVFLPFSLQDLFPVPRGTLLPNPVHRVIVLVGLMAPILLLFLSLVEILPSSIDRPEARHLATYTRRVVPPHTNPSGGCSNKCQVTNQEPGGLGRVKEVAPGH